MSRFYLLIAMALGLCLFSKPVLAACTSPAGQSGTLEYSSAAKIYRVCDGTNWQTILNDNMFAPQVHFRLDESSGTIASDSTSTTSGELLNTPTWQPAGGQIAGALSFNSAQNEFVRIGGVPLSYPYTLAFWMRRTASDASDYVAVLTQDTNSGIWFNPNSNILRVYDSSGTDIMQSGAISLNTWYHVAVTDDGTTSRFYINGSQVATSATRANFVFNYFGGLPAGYWFHGQLDDIRAYQYVLSAGDISALYSLTDTLYTCSANSTLNYVSANSVYTVCRDSLLRTMRKGATGASCSSGNRGALNYSSADTGFLMCNGTNWIKVESRVITDPTSGMTHRWNLDESAGTTAANPTGSNNGTLVSTPVWRPTGGRIAGAIEFDTASDVVNITQITTSTPITYSFWLKRTASVGGNYIGILTEDSDSGIWFDPNSNAISVYATDGTMAMSNGWLLNNLWYNVVLTDNGTTSILYINGKQVATSSTRVDFDIRSFGNTNTGSYPFTGLIDDVRIYNRAITATEAEDIFLSSP